MSSGFVYIWKNKINGKKYIGSHYGSENDNYIGSGLYFKRAYTKSPNNFVRKILEFHNGNQKELLQLEEKYLKKFNVKNSKEFYNLSDSAGGGENHSHLDPVYRKQMYERINKLSTEALLNKSPEEKLEIKLKKQNSWKKSPKLKSHSENTSKRRIEEELTKTPKDKLKFSKSCQKSYWGRSEEEINKHHKNQSEGVKNWHKNKSVEVERERIRKQKETKRKLKNKLMNNGINQKMIPLFNQQEFLNKGWVFGQLNNPSSL